MENEGISIIEQLVLLKSFVEISPLWLRRHVRPNQIAASVNRFLILASDPSDPSGSMVIWLCLLAIQDLTRTS